MRTVRSSKALVLLGGVVLAIGIIGVLNWRSDSFQQRAFPKKYWSQRVAELESSVRTDEYLIKHFRLELAKKALTAEVEIAQEVNAATLVDMDSHEAAKKAADRVKSEMTSYRDLIKSSQEDLAKKNQFVLFGYGPPISCRKALQSIYNGDVEKIKQAATYVGLPQAGKKLNYKGRLVTPFKINKSKAGNHITIVNDFIVVFAAGCIKGTTNMDLIGLEALFTHDLVNKYRGFWPQMSRDAKQQFKEIMKHEDASLEDRGLTLPATGRAKTAHW